MTPNELTKAICEHGLKPYITFNLPKPITRLSKSLCLNNQKPLARIASTLISIDSQKNTMD